MKYLGVVYGEEKYFVLGRAAVKKAESKSLFLATLVSDTYHTYLMRDDLSTDNNYVTILFAVVS